MKSGEKWDIRFLKMAKLVSGWSKDPSTKCGAVLATTTNRIISVGFNGLPQNLPDWEGWLDDREKKYQIILHAEENAILLAGHDITGATLFTTGACCAKCTSIALQAGVRRFVSYERPELEEREKWKDNMALARDLMFSHHEVPEYVRYPAEVVM